MASTSPTIEPAFAKKDRVVAGETLTRVPAGTPGKIILVTIGPRWTRYRVLFDNGEDVGSIDGSKLVAASSRD